MTNPEDHGLWQDIATAPMDGTVIAGQELYRFQPYKPDGARQMGEPGRWQRWDGYGWRNSEPPAAWMPATAREAL